MIVIDTNVVSETLKPAPDENVMRWMAAHSTELMITSITVGELSLGLEILPDGYRKAELRRLLGSTFDTYQNLIINYDTLAGYRYGSVVASRRAVGRPVTTEDAMIAAICLVRNLPLATRNTKDYDNIGLTLINPWNWGEEVI